MSKWKRRHSRPNPAGPRFGFERLESRDMLSSIPIVSGQTFTFQDGDGTTVKVKLTGPGSGALTLSNGQATGGSISYMTIQDTTAASVLSIIASGGADSVSTINKLVLLKYPGQTPVLGTFTGTRMNVQALNGLPGQLYFDGSVNNLSINDVNAGASIVVQGNLGQITADDFLAGASLHVTGTVGSLNATTIGPSAGVYVATLNKITTNALTQSVIFAGAGGIASAFIQNVNQSVINSVGNIGALSIPGSFNGNTVAVNVMPGTDQRYGTIDDYNPSTTSGGSIGTLTLGPTAGATQGNQIIVTGTIVKRNVPANVPQQPVVFDQAIAQFVPLQITQALQNTGFDDDEVWIALYGQEIPIPPPGVSPPPGLSYFIQASSQTNSLPTPIITNALTASVGTPNNPTLPSSTLTAWAFNSTQAWGSNLQFPVPMRNGYQFTGRILISAGAPTQAQVALPSYSVSAPSAASTADPSNGTFYDFLEFTVSRSLTGVVSLDVDTSQIDSFGMPMSLQFFKNKAGTQNFDYTFTGTTTQGHKTITGIPNTAGLGQGQPVILPGVIPVGATIQSIVNSTATSTGSVTLNLPASAAGTYTTLVAHGAGPVGVKVTRDSIIDPAGANSYLDFINSKVTANSAASPFLQTAAPYKTSGPVPIVGATSGASIVITTDSTVGLANGDQVLISGVQGVTANGSYTISGLTANSFILNSSNGVGTYASGGTWALAITGASNAPSTEITITASSTTGLSNGSLVEISGVQGNAAANGFFYIANVTSNSFKLVGSQGNGAYTSGGSWSVYAPGIRLVSPKDIVEVLTNPLNPNQLNNYWNELIDRFFLLYLPSDETDRLGNAGGGQTLEVVSSASGSPVTYKGSVVDLGTGANQGYVLQFHPEGDPSTTYNIYYPFSTCNATTTPAPGVYNPVFRLSAPPTWLTKPTESASQMMFANDGVFADNTFRGLSSNASKIVGDLENLVSGAFNRGVAFSPFSDWSDPTKWFNASSPQGATYNYWVEYWHQDGLTHDDLAYAFPYDDKFGASTNLDLPNVGLAKVTLGQWNSQAQSMTTFVGFPASAITTSPVTLKAHVGPMSGVSPVATGTITFYINGLPINSSDYSATPPIQSIELDSLGNASITALLPALPDGNTSHTYVVTAVYSGDSNYSESISYQPLRVYGPQGDFQMTLSPSTGTLGTQTQLTANLPGSTFDGVVNFSIMDGDGNVRPLGFAPVTSNTVVMPLTIPPTLLSFVGNVVNGDDVIHDVAVITNLQNGQGLTGTGIPAHATVDQPIAGYLDLSSNSTLSGSVRFITNGKTYVGTATAGQARIYFNEYVNTTNGAAITLVGDSASLTLSNLTQPSVKMNMTANASAVGTLISSNAAGMAFTITATFTPSSGGPYTAFVPFTATA